MIQNVSKDELSILLTQIEETAQKNPFEASNLLIELTRKFNYDSKVLSKVLLLKSDINNTQSFSNSPDNNSYAKTIVELSLKIVENLNKINTEDAHNINVLDTNLKAKYYKLIPQNRNAVLVENVNFAYKKKKNNFSLRNINLNLNYGEITAVIGENGNGKSTLLKIIANRLYPDSGQIKYNFFAGIHLNESSYLKLKQQIGYIPQKLPNWDGVVKDNLHFMAAIKGIRGSKNIEEVEFIINRLSLTKYKDYKWNELSSGFQTRFELANALIWNPKLLILDEPLANLDLISQSLFLEDLKDIASNIRSPLSILISSQHLHMMDNIADNIIFLKDGNLTFNAPKEDIGKDRKQNIFELESNLSISEVKYALKNIDVNRVITIGFTIVIYTGLEISITQLLMELTKLPGFTCSLIRDISFSTKSLLYATYEY